MAVRCEGLPDDVIERLQRKVMEQARELSALRKSEAAAQAELDRALLGSPGRARSPSPDRALRRRLADVEARLDAEKRAAADARARATRAEAQLARKTPTDLRKKLADAEAALKECEGKVNEAASKEGKLTKLSAHAAGLQGAAKDRAGARFNELEGKVAMLDRAVQDGRAKLAEAEAAREAAVEEASKSNANLVARNGALATQLDEAEGRVEGIIANYLGERDEHAVISACLLYTSPSPRDRG